VLPRPLLIAPAAAGVYAALLATTGPVEPPQARGSELSDALETTSTEVPVTPPLADEELGVPEPTPSPDPSPPPPEITPEPPPVPDVVPPVPEAPAPEAPTGAAPSSVAGAPDAGGARAADGAAPHGEAPDVTPRVEAAPVRARPRTERARRHPNTEARGDGVQRVSQRARERPEPGAAGHRGGGTPAGSARAMDAPAHWLSGSVDADPIAVPDTVIDEFGIPPFLLPIYQAAGLRYGVPWEVLAAINEVETAYGRNLSVSSAGAMGWMQFMPATWEAYGVDANEDGRRDPFSPVDAIFAAARYLRAAGADTDIRKAIYAYNHADWYVDSVVERAQAIARLPSDLVDSLAGLARGRFPVAARATYGVERRGSERSIAIFSRAGAPVIAVNDGRVVRVGYSARLGRFLKLRDVYGNTYTYGRLGRIAGSKRPVRPGARLHAGETLGRLARRSAASRAHLLFQIRPAGRAAPRIDPKPILDGWTLLESTAIHDSGRSRLLLARRGGSSRTREIGLLSTDALTRRVLANPGIELYACGRDDVRAGRIDRRVLATLEFLAASGLAPTVSSLRCGHGYLTASGNVSEHSTGSAVDISAINGTPIAGHQGAGSVTDVTIRSLLTLQGPMKPHQIISLMSFAGADNTFAMGDHADHIHVGFHPVVGQVSPVAWRSTALLEPRQWTRLIDRIDDLDTPALRPAAPE
jgi:murein DD-endopeptidase MepM/ murein hydrolase activator NlpD